MERLPTPEDWVVSTTPVSTSPSTTSLSNPSTLSLDKESLDFSDRSSVSSSSAYTAPPSEASTPSPPLPVVAVIGVGYVGKHLVDNFSPHYPVVAFDVSGARIKALKQEQQKLAQQPQSQQTTQPQHNDRAQHQSHKNHGGIGAKEVQAVGYDNVLFTSDERDLATASGFLIAVPTLLMDDRSIDLSYLVSALETVVKYARRGSTVVIESSIAVGTTRKLLGPIAVEHGYYAGMSPERVDPGRTHPPSHAIPKIISGLDDLIPNSLLSITTLYTPAFTTIVPVSRPEVAEMTKLYENCQRMVTIAYANEMADACIPHGIDPFEVSNAAATKPFGYLKVSPGVGVGGHCIPVNPWYLLSNSCFPLLEMAAKKMGDRPKGLAGRILGEFFGEKTEDDAAGSSIPGLRPRVLVVGIGFKPGQSHLTNSPGLHAAEALAEDGRADVMFADPLVEQGAVPGIPKLADKHWSRNVLEKFDVVLVAVSQPGLDYEVLDGLRGVKVEKWHP